MTEQLQCQRAGGTGDESHAAGGARTPKRTSNTCRYALWREVCGWCKGEEGAAVDMREEGKRAESSSAQWAATVVGLAKMFLER